MSDDDKQSSGQDEPQKRQKADSGAVISEEQARAQAVKVAAEGKPRLRILTGDRTTGKLHIGHYVGSLKQRVAYQSIYDTYILMADVQALTTHYDRPEILKQSVREVALDYMAVGLDPYKGGEDDGSKPKIVVQSMVPSIAELTVYYGLLLSVGLLANNPTTKAEALNYGFDLDDQDEQRIQGLLSSYPHYVPFFKEAASSLSEEFVGVDNLSEVELLRSLLTLLSSSNSTILEELRYMGELERYKEEVRRYERQQELRCSLEDVRLKNPNLDKLGFPNIKFVESIPSFIRDIQASAESFKYFAKLINDNEQAIGRFIASNQNRLDHFPELHNILSNAAINAESHSELTRNELQILAKPIPPALPPHRLETESSLASFNSVPVSEEIERAKENYERIVKSPLLARELREHIITVRKRRGLFSLPYGFLGYPVSQAADITFVGAHLVPVGPDQVPLIELCREVVQRFNNQYGKKRRVLTSPFAMLGVREALQGIDGNAKMSKSLNNAIYLSESDEEIWKKVKPAPTDPQRVRREDPGRPEVCNIFSYHKVFNQQKEAGIDESALGVATVEEVAENCRGAKWGCVECKQQLCKKLGALLDPMRERRSYWEQHEDDLFDILKAGTARANEEGQKTLERVRTAMHMDYFGG